MQPFIPENCLTEQLEWGKKQISLREIHSQESNTFFQFFFFFLLMMNLMYLLGQASGVLTLIKRK